MKTSSDKTRDNFGISLREIEQLLKAHSENVSRVQMETTILRNLFFPKMFDRESNMTTAGPGTFDWMFGCDQIDVSSSNSQADDDDDDDDNMSSAEGPFLESSGGELDLVSSNPETTHNLNSTEPDAREWYRHKEKDPNLDAHERERLEIQKRSRVQASEAFRDWLIASNGIFHISGSAGSGKSTLMRFLCDHVETTNLLHTWAGDDPLVFATFYFWRAGTQMQCSLQGLYRSILFEALRACTDLIPSIFPTEWGLLNRNKSIIDGAFLNAKTIQQAFGRLTSYSGNVSYRFCFFVDGLDEYDSDSVGHMQLAEMLLQWSNRENVKICVSSRPNNEFIFKFCDSPERRIHLHDLNHGDIYVLTRKMLKNDRNVDYLGGDHIDLVYQIVERSQGVFMWAVLVVRSIITGLVRRDSLSSLKKKLDDTPKDLDMLYQKLFDSMEDGDRTKANLMLLLAALKPRNSPLSVIQFCWIDELQDHKFPPLDGIRPKSWLSLEDMAERGQRQIAGITKGLLQIIVPSSRGFDRFSIPEVQFLHRSVEDYVDHTLKDTKLMRVIDKDTYVRLWIAEMTLMESSFRRHYWFKAWPKIPVQDSEEVSFHLLDTVRDLLAPGPPNNNLAVDTESSTRFYCGEATSATPFVRQFRHGQVSFICFVAKNRQQGYVEREIEKSEVNYQQECDPNLLLSVTMGSSPRLYMIEMLLRHGFSPAFCVQIYEDNPGEFDSSRSYRPWALRIPIWMIVLSSVTQETLCRLKLISRAGVMGDGYMSRRWEMLELLLGQPDIRPGDAHFILASESNNGEIEFLHVSQFIERFNYPKTATVQGILTEQGPSTDTVFSCLSESMSRHIEELSLKFDFQTCLSKVLDVQGSLPEAYSFENKTIVGLISGEHFLPAHWVARIM